MDSPNNRRNNRTGPPFEHVDVAGHRLEYYWTRPRLAGETALIFLHEGLGSAGLWRDFPARVAAATGHPALVYSRYGYGGSDMLAEPRGVDYMHHEALEVLPALRDALGIDDPILIGHSDGASIALIHAGAGRWPVRALVLEAAHVFVEDISITGIEAAKMAYETTDLPRKLARHHADTDKTFFGWNSIWLDPAFRSWNIESVLPTVDCPTLVIQGADDEYGTLAQVTTIGEQVAGAVETRVLDACGHSPHRDQPEQTLDAIVGFIKNL
ncbi:MAG: alpha/beta hydrolase [Alphaproteobacteria bacterium]|nr:alpha/beta hydrolase [Alphaproteobacteria bacterium]